MPLTQEILLWIIVFSKLLLYPRELVPSFWQRVIQFSSYFHGIDTNSSVFHSISPPWGNSLFLDDLLAAMGNCKILWSSLLLTSTCNKQIVRYYSKSLKKSIGTINPFFFFCIRLCTKGCPVLFRALTLLLESIHLRWRTRSFSQ